MCGCTPVNNIGADGAAALVEGLKVMTNLKELYLYSKCCMVGIGCEASGCDELHPTGCCLVWCGVHTGTAVRGPRAMMMWAWLESVDIVGARAKL